MTQPAVQPAPAPAAADCPQLTPDQLAAIHHICQERKVQSLTLLDSSPDYYDFLVDFRPEGILPWHAEDPFIAKDLENALHAYVDITTSFVFQLSREKGDPPSPYFHQVYQYGC